MRKSRKAAPAQLALFPTITQIPQYPCEINPKLVALLARLLREYAEREAAGIKGPDRYGPAGSFSSTYPVGPESRYE